MPNFSVILREIMTSLNLSQAAMAERLGVSQPFTSQMLAQEKFPRPDRLVEWATKLELTGEKRREFIRAGLLTQCPSEVIDEATSDGNFSDFYTMFRQALAWGKLSYEQFAKTVQCSPSFISRVADGHEKPPLDRINDWAAALNLKSGLDVPFLKAAKLTWSRHERQDEATKIAALERECAELRARLEQIAAIAAPPVPAPAARGRGAFQFPVPHASHRDDAAKQRAASGDAPYRDDVSPAIPAGGAPTPHPAID